MEDIPIDVGGKDAEAYKTPENMVENMTLPELPKRPDSIIYKDDIGLSYVLRTVSGMIEFRREGNDILVGRYSDHGYMQWAPMTLEEFDEMVKIVRGE